MRALAVKMIMNDRAKFLGILFGLSFATFIITQQAGIFVGLMKRTFNFITDTSQGNIWVMNPAVKYIDDVKPMKSTAIDRVKSISGVAWAVPLFKGLIIARLPSGKFQTCTLIGIDDATLIGGPPKILRGRIDALREPDAVIIDQAGRAAHLDYELPDKRGRKILDVGDTFELNDKRAYVVGISEVGRTFETMPMIYTTFNRALEYSPPTRNMLSFILVKTEAGVNANQLAHTIEAITGLKATTSNGFKKLTFDYYMQHTGIPINFGVAVLLGFVIGIAIAGQTFYSFAHDNLRYFATLKALGANNRVLKQILFTQAVIVAMLSWGIGIGITALFGLLSLKTELSFNMPWWLFLISAVALFSITLLSAYAALRKIKNVDPALAFQTLL